MCAKESLREPRVRRFISAKSRPRSQGLRRHNLPWVVDVDLKSFFNTIDHQKLIEILSVRISDKRFLRYIVRMLKAGILVEGNCQEVALGTPQGSIVSPILANIFLHHVLERRLADFGLSLNRDKTRTVDFGRESDRKGTFDFLGFTFYWGRWMAEPTLKIRTSMKTLQKKVQNFTHWIKGNRSRLRLEILWAKAAQKLRGHYQYYGVLWNQGKLRHFYYEIIGSLFRWLNRRSQKKSYTWDGFQMRLSAKPLPLPVVAKRLIQLTDPRLYCA